MVGVLLPEVKLCPCWWSEGTHTFRLTGWETRWSFPHPAHVSPCAACRGWKWWGRAALAETLWWSRSIPWADMKAPTRTLSVTKWRKRMWEQAFPVQDWKYYTLEFLRLSSTLFLILHAVWNVFSNHLVEIENWNKLQNLLQLSSLSLSHFTVQIEQNFSSMLRATGIFSLIYAAAAHRSTWCWDQFLVSGPQVWRQKLWTLWWWLTRNLVS